MNRPGNTLFFMMIFVFMLCSGVTTAAPLNTNDTVSELDNLTNYPRIERFEQGSVQVDFPSLESWPDFRFLRAWLPVEVTLNGDSKPRVGSAYVQATTDIDFEQRTVAISDLKVLKTRFSDEDESEMRGQLISKAFQGRESIVPLDVLLRLLPEDFEIPGQSTASVQLNFAPPAILVSEKPLKLLSIDKEPVKAPLEGTDIEYVVNTNWNVFYYRPDEQWYVLNESTWQRNNYLADGDWTTTDKLPADFDKLALDDNWPEVQKALPARKPQNAPLPFVISLEETELILLDGAPRLSVIDETGISYVSNTQSDLFKLADRWYFLVSGRWFSNTKLSGQWQAVKDLSLAFSRIPAEHKKVHVLYSVPGTRQAKLALIEAALPHRNAVAKSSAAKLEVSWVGEPSFEAIENTKLQRGLNTPFQVIKHNNYYYLCYEGAWYLSESPTGTWKVAMKVPDEIYRIPASDPAYNVTFVRLDSEPAETQDRVNYSYSSGYKGSFSSRVSVVYGTGWNYPSSVYWDSANGPAYWHYGRTYGYNTGYHPVGAYYGHRGGYYGRWGYGPYGSRGGYGPYGGWGYPSRTTMIIESPTVNYTQGYGSAWEGPLQTTPGDPSRAEDQSLEKYLPKKKVDGTEKFVKTSKADQAKVPKVSASSLYASASLSSNRFSDPDGNVYKHEDDGWSHYKDGNWKTMQAIAREQPVEPRPQQRPETQYRQGFIPAHKQTLSRSELDRQDRARIEGMDQYSKYRMKQEAKDQ
ncbi:MAG: hypothetical protein QNK19_04160 [Xanthomonadales bacterium]|nr:hypothetical protein [Xanthomonadales bacterium]